MKKTLTIGGQFQANKNSQLVEVNAGFKVDRIVIRSVSLFMPAIDSTSAIAECIYMIKSSIACGQDENILFHCPLQLQKYNDTTPTIYLSAHHDPKIEIAVGGHTYNGMYDLTLVTFDNRIPSDLGDAIRLVLTVEFIQD